MSQTWQIMKDLKELIRVISANKVSQIEIVGKKSSRRSKVQELYEGIINGTFSTDDEAAQYFYKTTANNVTYKKLKYRLQKRLLNTAFFIDVNKSNFTDAHKAFYSSYKEWAAIKIILTRGGRGIVLNLAEQVLRKAIEYELSDIIIDIARLMRSYHAGVSKNKQKYRYYDDLLDKYATILLLELKAEKYNYALTSQIGASRATRSDLEEDAIRYSEELEKYIETNKSYRFHLGVYQVLTRRYQVVNDYQNLLLVCKKAVRFFEQKKGLTSPVAVFLFQFKIVAAHTQLQQFEEGEKAAQKCFKLPIKGGHNWFAAYGAYIILLFHSKQYDKALKIAVKIMNDVTFKHQVPDLQELWRLYEAYLHYFIAIGIIDTSKMGEAYQVSAFRINKFMNNMPFFSKDKRGMNVHILILQILFLLQKKKYDDVIDRVEAINIYCTRYLKKNDTFRSNCFIKMLLQLPISGFHKQGVIRRAKHYRDKLSSVSIEVAEQSTDIEIIPYEKLWEYVLDALDSKFYFHPKYKKAKKK